jgi:DNA-binding CsgD family transcriptional regulator
MDKRYLLCFAAGLSAEQVSVLFSISPASVYTVRYRIRKKYMASLWSKGQKEDVFPW